jgi:hypothetical protein
MAQSGEISEQSYHHGVEIEGWMLKRGTRRPKQWNRRYFTLSGNNFAYYENPEDPKPKNSFLISSETGCEVGGMYIDERSSGSQKELLYCLRLTWSSYNKSDSSDETPADSTPASPKRHTSPKATKPEGQQSPPANIGRQRSSATPGLSVPDLDHSDQEKKPHRRQHTWDVGKPPRNHAGLRHRYQASDGFSGAEDSPRRHSFRSEDGSAFSTGSKSKKKKRFPFGRKSGKSSDGQDLDLDAISVGSSPEELTMRRESSEPALARLPKVQRRSTDESRYSYKDSFQNMDDYEDQAQAKRNMAAEQEQEQLMMQSIFKANKKDSKSKKTKKIIRGGQIAAVTGAVVTVGVFTAGIGLLAGLVVLGAGAAVGGTGFAAEAGLKLTKKKGKGVVSVILASPSYDEIHQWKNALDACFVLEAAKGSTWGHMFAMEGRNASKALLPTSDSVRKFLRSDTEDKGWSAFGFQFSGGRGETEHRTNDDFVSPETQWRPMEGGLTSFLGSGSPGLRIFREEKPSRGLRKAYLSLEGRPCPALKAQLVLNASPLDSFMCIMSSSRMEDLSVPLVPKSGQRASFRVIETVNDHMDVIHMIFDPVYLFPTWTAPRDYVLFRYWRLEPDGTYVICCDSVEHADCPPHSGYTRGEMHCVHTISPRKKHYGRSQNDDHPECLLTCVMQVDPRGWVPTASIPCLARQAYAEAFGVTALMQLLDYRDALEFDRFVPVSLDPHPIRHGRRKESIDLPMSMSLQEQIVEEKGTADIFELSLTDDEDADLNYDYTYSARESVAEAESMRDVARHPPPFNVAQWAEPDPNSFRVRGKMYCKDRKKYNAGDSIGRLIAVDVVRVEKAIYSGFTVHPTERVQRALEREKRMLEKGLKSDMPPFIFVVNIVLPGPPFYHGVFYFAIDDMSTIDGTDGTPSSKLCKKFFFEDSDKFRDDTFKMIPQIVEGNFLVRKAVGNTPAIMGTKLRQLYVRSDRFCEVILDCGSSSIAVGVIRLSLGYTKTLVVDMGFLFEGKDESTLPERMFGCVRVKRVEYGDNLRFVPQPPEVSKVQS